MTNVEIPPGGREVGDPPWDPWRPADIARLLAGVSVPWYVAGGREPQRDGAWVCRRDQTIGLPYGRIIRRTGDGIPYLAPEIVLLFKAKHVAVPKNEADFVGTLPLLDRAAVGWLRWALSRVHPGHAWTGAL